MINVCRFNEHIPFVIRKKRFRFKKKSRYAQKNFTFLGVDPVSITDGNGTYPVENYTAGKNEFIFTLTQRESDLIAIKNPGIKPPLVLEKEYPWLPLQKYLGCSKKSFHQINRIVKKFNNQFFNIKDYSNSCWNTVCNTVRMTSNLDACFYSAWHTPIQEAYLLEEKNPEKCVIAIDFNALYPSCMQYSFPDPGKMIHISYQRYLEADEELPVGLYRCHISKPSTSFIQKYNPFKIFFSGKYLGASLIEGIKVDLNEFEIDFYKKHFSQVYIEEAIVAERIINHPLALAVRRSYAQRKNYIDQGRKDLANREKFRMILMSSCTNRPGYENTVFNTSSKAMSFLHKHYGISAFPDEPVSAMATWLDGRKKIFISSNYDNVTTTTPALKRAEACFSLSQRIVARGRTILLDKMEKIAALTSDVEIAYCNIDSIHFSVNKSSFASVYAALKAESSSSMGGFKIDAVTKHGLWLEPGRYWLYGQTIEKFANKGVSDNIQPFKDQKIYVKTICIEELYIPIRISISLSKTMSNERKLFKDEGSNYVRFISFNITKEMRFNDVLEILKRNYALSISIKTKAFNSLRERILEC